MVKRGQAAMEFLITYGWAILAVLISIAALTYFGVLNPSRFLPESCILFPGLACNDVVVSYANSNITMVVTNGFGSPITINDVKCLSCTGSPGVLIRTATGDQPAPQNIQEGEKVKITLTGINPGNVGSRFKSDIAFTYSIGQTGIIYTMIGSIASQVSETGTTSTSTSVTTTMLESSSSVTESTQKTTTTIKNNFNLGPGIHDFTLEFGGDTRQYRVYVPASYDKTKAMPVILVLHGGGGQSHSQAQQTCPDGNINNRLCLHNLGNKEGFIVVYPNGTAGLLAHPRTWNAGNCCAEALRKNVDDVGFFRAMLNQLGNDFDIDEKKIYSTGMSNGAMMSYRLACQLSDKIAAIAPVSGGMGIEDSECNPVDPVSIIHFHGTLDPNYPYNGGYSENDISQTNFRSVQDSLDGWVTRDGCSKSPSSTELPDNINDGVTETLIKYTGCDSNGEIELYRINNGGHTWPGGYPNLPESLVGKLTYDINANQLMIDFFKSHPKN